MRTPPVSELWGCIERWRTRPHVTTEVPDLLRLTRDDLDDDSIRAATLVALVGLGTDRLAALLDLRDALASGAAEEWFEDWAREAS